MANNSLNGFLLPTGAYEEKAVPPGEWKAFDGFAFLAGIADRMDVRDVQSEMEEITSIPDLWAQVAGFAGALAATRHPRHALAVEEWRGLIALLALGQIRGWSLDFQVLNIDDGAALVQRDEMLPFGAVALHNCPPHKVVLDMDWRRLVLLGLEKRPVALMNPWTLLCPVRDHISQPVGGLPWVAEGRFRDPMAGDHLGRHDLEILAEFCQRLAGKLSVELRTRPDGLDADLANLLATRFTEFKDAITRSADLRQLGDLTIPTGDPQPYPGSTALPHWLFREVASTGETGGGVDGSDILIPARADFRDQLRGCLLIDPALAVPLDQPLTAVKAWKNYSLAALINPSATLRDTLNEQLRAEKIVMITPDALFTPYLVRMRDREGAFFGHPEEARGFILPLTPLALLLLSPDDLRRALAIRSSGSGGYEVELTLRLERWSSDRETIPFSHKIKWSYAAEKVVDAVRPGALSLWPDFVHPAWRRYFVLSSTLRTKGGRQPRAAALVTTRSLSAVLGRGPLNTLAQDLAGDSRSRTLSLMEESCELLPADSPVEAVICDVPSPASGADANERIIAGLVMFRYSDVKPPPGIGNAFKVGIDFGTTNTTVFARVNSDSPFPLSFADRFVHALDGDDLTAKILLARQFSPVETITPPFLTALRSRPRNEGLEVRAMITDTIVFGETSLLKQLQDQHGLKIESGTVHFDIKWQTDSEARRRVEAFLTQVVMMAAAEAIGYGADFRKILWNFSYPEAFSRDQRTQFEAILPRAVKNALDIPLLPENLRTKAESSAAAMYFHACEQAAFHDTAIAIDMGGRTSDISIWQDGHPVWENSLKFAGRDLIVHYLTHNAGVFELIDSPRSEGIVDQIRQMITQWQASGQKEVPNAVTHAIELTLNHPWYTESFDRNYPLVAGEDIMKKLRHLAVLGLAGVLHYVALVIRHLIATNRLRCDDGIVTVSMGGRGSLLFRSYFGDKQAHAFTPLAKLFQQTSGLANYPQHLALSRQPKSEVGYGLLAEPVAALGDGPSTISHDLPLGSEVWTVNGDAFPSNSLLSDLPTGTRWKGNRIDAFAAFLTDVEKETRYALPLSLLEQDRFLNALSGSMAEAQSAAQRVTGDERAEAAEPPFIIQLRTFIKEIAADRTVTIRET